MNSNASTIPPVAACNRFSSTSASGRLRAANVAVAYARVFGTSFITAAVMTPSVPSAPMNRSRRS